MQTNVKIAELPSKTEVKDTDLIIVQDGNTTYNMLSNKFMSNKQNKLVAGTNITIDESSNTISATDTVTTATTSGSGNAVTAITATDGVLTVIKGSNFVTTTDSIFSEKIQSLTNPTAINANSGTIVKLNLSSNTTLSTLTANAGTTLTLIISNSGSYTITWPSIKWASGTIPSLTSYGIDMVKLFFDGTYWYGNVVGDFK